MFNGLKELSSHYFAVAVVRQIEKVKTRVGDGQISVIDIHRLNHQLEKQINKQNGINRSVGIITRGPPVGGTGNSPRH